MTWHEVLEPVARALGDGVERRAATELRAKCPVCGHGGMSAIVGDNGQPVIHCRGKECKFADIMTALGLEPGLTPAKATSPADDAAEKSVMADSERLHADAGLMQHLREGRGLDDRTILTACLGHDGQAYTLPVRAAGGRVLYVKRYDPNGGKRRYLIPSGAKVALYGAETLANLKPATLVIVTEGEFDALRCRSMGYTAVSGTCGAGTWRLDWSRSLACFDLVIAGDHDKEGRAMAKTVSAKLLEVGCQSVRVITWPDDAPEKTDVSSYVLEHGERAFHQLVATAVRVGQETISATARPDPIPELPATCWRPGFAEFREAWSGTTEAADAFLWCSYIVVAGLMVGRRIVVRCGEDIHANIYATLVGASGRSRKSTAQRKADRLRDRVDLAGVIEVSHGIGSPEGLIKLLSSDGGVLPRRGLIYLGETSSMLRKAKATATDGLPPLLCACFDGMDARLPNRREDLKVTDPFLSIYGATTQTWLHASLSLDDVHGGLANRFVYIVGQEKEPMPMPPGPDDGALDAAEGYLRRIHDWNGPDALELTPRAVEIWSDWYSAERARSYPSATLEALAQRLHVFALKTALIHAVLEGSHEISTDQIRAGCDFADYQRDAQLYVLGEFGGSRQRQIEDKLLAEVERFHADGVKPKRRLLQPRVRRANGVITASEFNMALRALVEAEALVIEDGCIRLGGR